MRYLELPKPWKMNKKALRSKYKTLRSQLSADEIDAMSMDIANKVLELPIWGRSFYHIFLPIQKQKELNTEFILHILQGKDKHVVVSKSNFETYTMENFLLTDTTPLKVNSLGIPEPVDGIPIANSQIEVVFIPLLAYDRNGNRVGYGKGFYDRFLESCHPNTLKVGLSFFPPEDKIEDSTSEDVPLDFCVTPTDIFKFNK